MDAPLTLRMGEVQVPVRDSARSAPLVEAFEHGAPALYRFILIRVHGDRAAADELLQQTCLEAIRHRRPPGERDACIGWMTGIARNLVRRHWRSRKRERLAHEVDAQRRLADWLDRTTPPDLALVNKEMERELLRAIKDLPTSDQAVLFGFYFDGRSQAELAAQLDITEKSVEARLYRARSRLRKKLRDGKEEC